MDYAIKTGMQGTGDGLIISRIRLLSPATGSYPITFTYHT
jgi:hypothetical protein